MGIILIGSSILIHTHSKAKLSFAGPHQVLVSESSHSHNVPTFISLSSISVNLPVNQTVITNGIWEISDKGVSHLGSSAYPGENKGIVMYAHNTDDRFGKLHELGIGEEIKVNTRNGKSFIFKVESISIVNPNELSILHADSETLILYTCTGFADLKRLVVKATIAQ